MATHPDYPGVSSFQDRHGKTRWRFRAKGMPAATIAGEPGTEAFDEAYKAAVEGRVVAKAPAASTMRNPDASQPASTIHPASLNDCWAKVKARPKFQKLDPATRYQYTYLIEDFLAEPWGGGKTRGDGPVADLEARHIQDALDEMSPSNSTVLRVVLKKLFKEAALQGWIKYSPLSLTEAVGRDPDAGFKTWPPELCARFEAYWPIGTAARTVYEIARWLGVRRSDIAALRWDQLVTKVVDGEAIDGFLFTEHKGRNRKGAYAKFHPMSPMLAEALAPLDRSTGTVVVNRHGKPFRVETLSQRMWEDWCPQAGIPRGYGLHGLRKAMGAMLADAGASLHESRDALGHATYKEVATYNKGRDQAKGAVGGMRAVVRLVRGS